MKKEIRKEVLIYLIKQDFKGMSIYLKQFIGEEANEEYFKRVFNNIKERPWLKGEIKFINRDFLDVLDLFNKLK